MTAAAAVLPAAGADQGADWALRLDRHGNAPALLAADGTQLSYRALLALADAWRARFAADGGRRFVALLVRNDIASIAAYLGALRGGHPVLLLDADGDATRILAQFAPDVVAWPGEDRIEIAGGPPARLHPDLALLLSTSGSTGSPKLVRLSAGAIAANAAAIVAYLELGPDERAITTLGLQYSFGMSIVNSHLMAGASIIVTDLSVTHPAFEALLHRLQPTSLSGVPYLFELLERTGIEDRLPASITALTQAGGRLPAGKVRALAMRHGVRFFAMYGQTEAGPRMAYLPPELAADHPDCIGRAIPGGEFWLRSEDGAAIATTDSPGELVYRGPNVMMGYATTRDDLALGTGPAELFTGDIAERNAAGLYRIVGRASRFAKIAGLRIGFDDIEAVLQAAGHAAVVGGDDSLISVHVEAADTPAERARLAALVAARAHVPESAVVVVTGDVPRLSTGKVDYAAIRTAGATAVAARSAAAAQGAHPILAGFRRAFNRPALAATESFGSAGGDSLAYVNAAIAVEKSLGHLPAHWEAMSIDALVALAPAAPPAPQRFVRVPTETLVRLFALLLVIIGHAMPIGTEALRGGSTILFLMAGYNVARFQRPGFEAGRIWPALSGSFERMILPYLLLMLPLLYASGAPRSWGWFALVSVFTVDYAQRGPLFAYWFIESVFHALIVTCLLFQLPPLRRLSHDRPFAFGLVLLALAIAAKLLVPAYVFDDPSNVALGVDGLYYLYALGWLALVARGRAQQAVVLGLAIALVGWDQGLLSSRQVWIGLSVAALLLVAAVPIPSKLAPPLLRVAAASYFVYILHVVFNHILRFELGLDARPWLNLPALLVLSIAGGLVFEAIWSRVLARASLRFGARRSA